MKISKQARRDAKQLLRSCLDKGVLSEDRVRKAFSAVVDQKPRNYLSILSQLQHLVKLNLKSRSAVVESSTDLNSSEQAAVTENLVKKYGPGLNISFATNPSLLGGLRIQVGSDVYDGSVRARLMSLSEAL